MLKFIFSTNKKIEYTIVKPLNENLPSTIIKKASSKYDGFTMIELIIGIAILGIITAIAMPSLNQFLVSMRIDNEISQIHRLVLSARNSAISMERNVTLCPLNGTSTCVNAWGGNLSVFIDLDNDNIYEPANNETLLKVKPAIQNNDTLTYAGFNRITFAPTGQLSAALNSTFIYCPQGFNDLGRAVLLSASGRAYQSSDVDGDGKDEDRNGNEIACP
ncbi:MAG: type IV fimbrial biogenesis protein FimT [Colwellia sp.]|jgi:type IV fimbrial biogenesis protein FimT